MVLPVFYSARELVEINNHNMDSPYSILKEEKNPSELKSFIEILSNELIKVDGLEKKESITIANNIVDIYCEFYKQERGIIDKNLFQKFISIYKKIYDMLFMPHKILKKIINPNNKDITLAGYEDHENWLEIERLIIKYNIKIE